MNLPGFAPKPPSLPPTPTPPQRDDPAIAAARDKTRLSALQRKGRSASIRTKPADRLGDVPVARPQARAAQVLGG